MKENQETVCRWAESTFGNVGVRRAFLRYAEEFVELAEVLGFFDTARVLREALVEDVSSIPFMPEMTDERIRKAGAECADGLITLYRVADKLRCDLHDTVDVKMVVNRARKWAVTVDGVGQHVSEPSDGG